MALPQPLARTEGRGAAPDITLASVCTHVTRPEVYAIDEVLRPLRLYGLPLVGWYNHCQTGLLACVRPKMQKSAARSWQFLFTHEHIAQERAQ